MQIEQETDLLSYLESESHPDPMADFTGISSVPSSSGVVPSQAGVGGSSGGLASAPDSVGSEVGGDGSLITTIPNDCDDSGLEFGQYIQRFKETFIKARSLEEIKIFASGMTFKDYLDYVVKLLPKDVKIQGEFNFVHQLEQLGPIDRSAYLLPEPEVVQVEITDVSCNRTAELPAT